MCYVVGRSPDAVPIWVPSVTVDLPPAKTKRWGWEFLGGIVEKETQAEDPAVAGNLSGNHRTP
jgi:hypothetical protein